LGLTLGAPSCLEIEQEQDEAVDACPACALPAPQFSVVAGTTQKICQLTGDTDFQTDEPTPNATSTRFRAFGTDLGSSFEHDGKLWFLFGDTVTDLAGATEDKNPEDADSIAFTTDDNPVDCVALDFVSHPDDPGWFKAPVVPGVNLGASEVPLDGISSAGHMYVWFATDEMSRSVLARSSDNAQSFSKIYDFSSNHFINISADLMPDEAMVGLDPSPGGWVLLFGSGKWRKSDIYLAAAPLADIENPDALRFFAGREADGRPVWSPSESKAVAVIDTQNPLPENPDAEGCVGELSVHYNKVAEAWIASYNCEFVRIDLHTAALPWGPWSDPVVVFDTAKDGWCTMLSVPGECDHLGIPGNEAEVGSPYAPYIIERYTKGNRDKATLYFTMSTWNPYEVQLMKTEIKRQ